eukprot:CAMPEP_0197941034 /NCGR_PEP_ID=MMETSP1439-20131203/122185_1 /TAXON_ID=66791 /ORGANISM="Gonyaulax spinifera, Strain CCMP409" /LENGTH=50 /DNA_ID=CAMNT_0043564219 /DNA_START=159 /DNA_END=308 /DNA_ORIENTATION=+
MTQYGRKLGFFTRSILGVNHLRMFASRPCSRAGLTFTTADARTSPSPKWR